MLIMKYEVIDYMDIGMAIIVTLYMTIRIFDISIKIQGFINTCSYVYMIGYM